MYCMGSSSLFLLDHSVASWLFRTPTKRLEGLLKTTTQIMKRFGELGEGMVLSLRKISCFLSSKVSR